MIGSSSGAIVSAFAACGVDLDEAAAKVVQLMDYYQVRWMLAALHQPWLRQCLMIMIKYMTQC
jgi:predicted acylesterase/phospholipase RssA